MDNNQQSEVQSGSESIEGTRDFDSLMVKLARAILNPVLDATSPKGNAINAAERSSSEF